MSYNLPESPLLQRGLPAIGQPMLNTRRERTAIRAMVELRAIGANPLPTHRLPNGMGYVAPDTGIAHGPTSDPRGIDCGCGWGDLCDAPTRGYFTGRPYSLCGAQLERGALPMARFRAPDPWSNDPDRTTRHWAPEAGR